MRHWEGLRGTGTIQDELIRQNFFKIDRFLHELAAAGILAGQPPRTGAGGGVQGDDMGCCPNQVDEFELVNDSTEGILSFGRTTQEVLRSVEGHSLSRIEGFELGTRFVETNGDTITGAGVTFSTTTKRTGNRALRINLAAAAANYLMIPAFDAGGLGDTNNHNAMAVRVWIFVDTMPDAERKILELLTSVGAAQTVLTLDSSGILRLDGNVGTTPIAVDTWTEITIKYDSQGSGSVSLQLSTDGLTRTVEFNGTTPASADPVRTLRLGATAAAGSYDIYFDDVAIETAADVDDLDYPLPGGVHALALDANGQAISGSWALTGAATAWETQDEPHDDNTTYMAVSNNGSRHHTFSTVVPASFTEQINGVEFRVRGITQAGAGSTTVNLIVSENDNTTVTSLTTVGTVTTSYQDLAKCYGLSPFSSEQWALDEVEVMAPGVSCNLTGGISHVLRVTTVTVLVDVGDLDQEDVARAIRVTADDGFVIPAYLVGDGEALASTNKGWLVLGTDGTNAQILSTDSTGKLQVTVSGATAPSETDDAAFTIGSDAVSPSGFLCDETSPDSVDEGDIGLARMTADRKLLFRLVGSTDANRLEVNSSGRALVASASEFVDSAAYNDETDSAMVVGMFADESPSSVSEGDVGVPRMTLDRKVIITQRPHATGEGCDTFRSIDLDESEEEVKSTAGKIYGWYLANLSTEQRFVKFYNLTAADTDVGTDTPFMTVPVPPLSAANVEFSNGITFSVALSIAATTGVADADTGAPGANEIVAHIYYK